MRQETSGVLKPLQFLSCSKNPGGSTNDGLSDEELQWQGKKKMQVEEFLKRSTFR